MVMETCEILKGEKVHEKLLKGSQEIAKAVSTTFGPYGKNVAITMTYNLPHVTKDGATVSRHIKLKDPVENVAAQIINQAAARTAEVAGDGTTSTTILSTALIENAFVLIKQGYQPIHIKNYLKEAEKALLEKLQTLSSTVEAGDIENIALVACNNDKEIAELVTKAFKVIGEHGIVTVSDSKNYETTIDVTEGIKLDRSHILPVLSGGKSSTRHSNCRIAVTNCDIKTEVDALVLLEIQERIQAPLLIICNDLVGDAAKAIAYNKIERGIPIEVIRAPYIAEARTESLEDLAIVTGAILLDKATGWSANQFLVEHLGSCDNLEITLKETNIVGRKGDPKAIQERIEYYNTKISEDKEGLKVNYKKRLALFESGAAVIYVGGANEVEIQEKKDRLDDTIRAVKSALEEGYVVGGTITYNNLKTKILKNGIQEMVHKSLDCLTETLLDNSNHAISYEEHMDFVKKNHIIDPTLVIKSTIQNAIGAAIMVFTTDCVVIKEGRDGH